MLSEINGKHGRTRLSLIAAISGAMVVAVMVYAGLQTAAAICAVLVFLSVFAASYLDNIRRSVVLFYDFEPDALARYEGFVRSFEHLIGTDSIWHVAAEGNDHNWKRNGGATRIQNRNSIRPSLSSPRVVKSNIDVPGVAVGKQVLHFFPDRVLVVDSAQIGAVEYSQLQLDVQSMRFVEDGRVPSDAKVVGHTWLHPNRNGGPDRRFSNNKQLPICAYDEGHLSGSGLNELVQVSAEGRLAPFAAELRRLASLNLSAKRN